jgi:hypothetical protein
MIASSKNAKREAGKEKSRALFDSDKVDQQIESSWSPKHGRSQDCGPIGDSTSQSLAWESSGSPMAGRLIMARCLGRYRMRCSGCGAISCVQKPMRPNNNRPEGVFLISKVSVRQQTRHEILLAPPGPSLIENGDKDVILI